MPISLSITNNVQATLRTVAQLQTDSKFALRTATTRTAAALRKALEQELKTKLDRPVPFITRAYRFEQATSLEAPIARVYVADPQRAEYIQSIARSGKHIEIALTRYGRAKGVLRPGESFVPTRALRANARGNISVAKARRFIDQGILIDQGPDRGLYVRRGRRKLVKVLTPARIARYRPRVNVLRTRDQIIADFPRLYKQLYDRNVRRTIFRAN